MSTGELVPREITLRVRDACLCLHLQRAARATARHFDEAFRPLGLTSGQFSLLMSLNRPEPPSIGAVAALLAMDRTTLTANLKPLVRRGLVAMAVDPADRRRTCLSLTAAGRAALAAVERRLAAGAADRLRADLRLLSGPQLPAGCGS